MNLRPIHGHAFAPVRGCGIQLQQTEAFRNFDVAVGALTPRLPPAEIGRRMSRANEIVSNHPIRELLGLRSGAAQFEQIVIDVTDARNDPRVPLPIGRLEPPLNSQRRQ